MTSYATQESCAFCGKHKDTVTKLIVGPDSAICNECVTLCVELLEDPEPTITNKPSDFRDPREIRAFLDQYVIGQEQAKIALSVAVVNHYKRLDRGSDAPDISKANILVIGPTGSGKTLLAKTISQCLDVPFVIADATSITEAGYVGDDAEMMISRLFAASGYDIEKTQRGIVFIDEIDKIARKGESSSLTRDVSGEGVQQALLKLVEGTVCRFPSKGHRKNPTADMTEIDTANILFIAGGAFVGLDSIVQRRLQGNSIGFAGQISSQKPVDIKQVTADDLVQYGIIPELIGRFPITVGLDPLKFDDFKHILTGVRNNLVEQYRWLIAQDGVGLDFDESAIDALAHRAMTRNTGARSLQSEIERVLLPYMYNIQDHRESDQQNIIITADIINKSDLIFKE